MIAHQLKKLSICLVVSTITIQDIGQSQNQPAADQPIKSELKSTSSAEPNSVQQEPKDRSVSPSLESDQPPASEADNVDPTYQTIPTPATSNSQLKAPSQGDSSEDRPHTIKLNNPPQVPIFPNLSDHNLWGLSFGFNIPDVFPISIWHKFNPHLAVTLYFVPELPFDVRVEYRRGVIANQNGLAIENPDTTVRFDGIYGPQWGLEGFWFPTGSRFFMSMGLGRRELSLDGGLANNLIISSSAGSIATNSVIELSAKARVVQDIGRFSIGWVWPILNNKFFLKYTLIGYAFPLGGRSQLSMRADIVNPSAIDQINNEIIDQAERTFEQDLTSQSLDDVRKVEVLGTPITGLTVGLYF